MENNRRLIPPKVPNVRFNLTNNKGNEALIILRIRIKGKRFNYSTGWKINPNHWDQKAGRAKHVRGKEEYLEMNNALSGFREVVQNIFIQNNYGEISFEDLKEKLDYETGKTEHPKLLETPTLFSFIEDYISQEQNKVSSNRDTWKKFITVFNHLKEYEKEKKLSLDFSKINWQFLDDFTNWLYLPPRNHSINNASKIMEVVKQFMREAQKRELHENRVYQEKGFGVKRAKVKNKVRLTFEEINQLLELDLSDNERLEKVRDLFIVGAYTGLRFSDWHKIRRSNIIEDEEGQLLQIMTKKTNTKVVIPILPTLEQILDKYSFNLPKISIQKFNEYIKEVCQIALEDNTFLRIYSESGTVQNEITEKWRKISSHAARRSFASNFWEKGIPAALLMQITGHATEKQFFEYIDVKQEDTARQFAKMARQLFSD